MARVLFRLGGAVLAGLILLPGLSSSAVAGKWDITPSISVTGTYTDNASLAALPARGTFVTQVAPGIHIAGGGARFKGNLDYIANAIVYSNDVAANTIANTLSGQGTLEAIEKFFYVDVFGNVQQTFLSPFAPQPSNIYSVTSNRAEARTFGLSPYVRGRVGSAFSYQLRYRDSWTTSNRDILPNLRTRQWTGRAASPIRLFGWALDYDDTTVKYGETDFNKQLSRLYRATVYFQPDVTLRLDVSGGREQNNYFSLETRSNKIYGGGVLWKPTPLSSAEIKYEHRYFGASRLASLQHRSRLTAWTLTYSRNAATYQQALLTLPPGNTAALLDAIFTASIPDPIARQAAVAQFLQASSIPAFLSSPVSFFTQQVFLQENVDASVAILGKRSSVILDVFGSKSQALTTNFNSTVPDAFALAQGSVIRQHGFGISANRQVTGSTSLGASARRTYARQDQPAPLESRNDFFTLSLTKTLSPKTETFAGFGYSRFETESTPPSTSRARSVYAGLNHRF